MTIKGFLSCDPMKCETLMVLKCEKCNIDVLVKQCCNTDLQRVYVCVHMRARVESPIDPFLATVSLHGNWVG